MTNAFDPNRFTPPFSGPPTSIGQTIAPVSATPAGSTDDLFAGLLELQWKSVGFPYVSLRSRLRQDLAIHKFLDQNGAHIEGTGRAPLEFTARVPFINGLDQGKNEHWQRPLYPFTRDNMLRACMDKTSGVLQHPELGDITCKLETFEWTLEANARGGVWADITWIETDDSDVNDIDQDLQNPSPLADAQAAANDLDAQLQEVDLSLYNKPLALPPTSFGDFMFAIRGVVDQTTLMQKQFAGRIDNLLYSAQSLQTSLDLAGNANALNWPMIDACERAKSAAYDLKATLLVKGKTTLLYTAPANTTLSDISNSLGASISDLMILNPALVQSPVIPAGAIVRYYGQ